MTAPFSSPACPDVRTTGSAITWSSTSRSRDPSRNRGVGTSGAPAQTTSSRAVIEQLVAQVQLRHPSASDATVRRSVAEAIDHFRDASVDTFLAILIERRASDAIAAAHATGATPNGGGPVRVTPLPTR